MFRQTQVISEEVEVAGALGPVMIVILWSKSNQLSALFPTNLRLVVETKVFPGPSVKVPRGIIHQNRPFLSRKNGPLALNMASKNCIWGKQVQKATGGLYGNPNRSIMICPVLGQLEKTPVFGPLHKTIPLLEVTKTNRAMKAALPHCFLQGQLA